MIVPDSFRRCRTGLAALCVAVLSAHAGTYKTITIDGSYGDWAGVPIAHDDPADSTESADYRRIYLANDDDYLYLRFTLERAADPFLSNSNLFLDTDADVGTGHVVVVGSELLVQGGSAFDERGGGFNEGGVTELGWLSAPSGAGTEFEVRISRHAKYVTDGAAVFGGDTVSILLEAEDSKFAQQETAPDSEGLLYTFAPVPPPLTSPVTLVGLTTSGWRVNDSGTDLGTAWREPGYDDSGAGWRNGSGLFGYTSSPGVYPAPISTPLAASVGAAYLRTTFSWDANAAGLVFVVTNVLSDGAVFYLNGAEVRRVRLPAGDVTYTTGATGGPAVAGQPEVFGISGASLVTGDNVLAVELHPYTSTPEDLVFGTSLTASPSFPVRLVDATQPADRTLVAGESTTLTAEVLGTPPLTYEWFRNEQRIDGANGPTLTLDPVLQSDDGTYVLKVTNPGGSVSTRGARLNVTVNPVSITDETRPADLTVVEGRSVTFDVAVKGSPLIAYQWLKGGFPIDRATEATYTISEVKPGDAGEYVVRISNPATPGLLSRTATLVVRADQESPTVNAVSGTPNRVTVTFSEPVDPVTAGDPSRYGLDGGLSVIASAVSVENPAVVVLTTSKQTLFASYVLGVSGVKDRFGNIIAPGTSIAFRSIPVVDGSFDDWADVAVAHSDPAEAPEAGTDFKDLWVANDDQYLYIRFTLHAPGNPGTFLNNIFLDTDTENPGFGTYGVGSELLIQQGAGYQEKNGGFNEGPIDGLDFALLPEGEAVDFELRISRSATYASDRLPVFVGDTVVFFLETENSNFETTDTAPDSGGLSYTWTSLPPATPGPLSIRADGDRVILTWEGSGRLQVRDSLGGGDWVDVAGAASGSSISPGGSPKFYRVSQ